MSTTRPSGARSGEHTHPTIASTAAASGLQIITVFQDLAQVRHRYGDRAGTVVNNHKAKLLLPGISDLDTLD